MSWKYKALLHAQREDPKESCGLLLNVQGKERYYPCRNLSMTEHQCFIIDPEDYIKADNTGEITAVVHSHPKHLLFRVRQIKLVVNKVIFRGILLTPRQNNGDIANHVDINHLY